MNIVVKINIHIYSIHILNFILKDTISQSNYLRRGVVVTTSVQNSVEVKKWPAFGR